MDSSLRERIAYLQGLASGMDMETQGRGGQITVGILNVLEEMAENVDRLNEDVTYLEDYLVEVDAALGDVEISLWGDDWLWEMTCPHCEGEVYFDQRDLEEQEDVIELICPICEEPLDLPQEGDFDEGEPAQEVRSPQTTSR